MRRSIVYLLLAGIILAGCSTQTIGEKNEPSMGAPAAVVASESNKRSEQPEESKVGHTTSLPESDKGTSKDENAAESPDKQSAASTLPTLVVDNPFLQSDTPITPIVEWKSMQDKDAELPLVFGGHKATLYMGRDHPNGMKFLVLFDGEEVAVSLPIEEDADTTLLERAENGEIPIQAAAIDLDGDGVLEIVIVTSDGLIEGGVWVFSYTEVANKAKVNPFRQEMFEMTQGQVQIQGNKIDIPYGSQGLFDEYLYTADGIYTRNN